MDPLKLNCFVWRVFKNRILICSNLAKCGVMVESNLCPFCCRSEESPNHIFFVCTIVSQLWNWFAGWSFVISHQPVSCVDLTEMLDLKNCSKKMQKLRLSLVYSMLLSIWKEQNAIVFWKKRQAVMIMADVITICPFN